MKTRVLVGSILFSLALPLLGLANGLPGQRLEKDLGNYVIDIGTDQDFTPQAGAPVKFDFYLLGGQSGVTLPGGLRISARNPAPFTDLNVRILQDGKPFLESDVAYAQHGPTFLTYAFPNGGEFTLQTTFYSKDDKLADASFPITIGGDTAPGSGGGSSSGGLLSFIFGSIFGVVIGAVVGFFVSSSLQKKTV